MPTVRLSTHARASYERLSRDDRPLFLRVDRALDRLMEHPEIGKPLAGPLSGHRSHRIGAVRVIYRYEGDSDVVLVLDIARRDKVYRRQG